MMFGVKKTILSVKKTIQRAGKFSSKTGTLATLMFGVPLSSSFLLPTHIRRFFFFEDIDGMFFLRGYR